MSTQYYSTISNHKNSRAFDTRRNSSGVSGRAVAVAHKKNVHHRYRRNTGLLLILALGIIVGSTFFASSRSNAASNEPMQYKYYTSIQVQPGDTLWSIAGKYALDSEVARQEYVDEVIRMNHLHGETIHAGDYLTIAYYSEEFK